MDLGYATLHDRETGRYRFFIYDEDGEVVFDSEAVYASEAEAQDWIRRTQQEQEP